MANNTVPVSEMKKVMFFQNKKIKTKLIFTLVLFFSFFSNFLLLYHTKRKNINFR
jgi:hypothetical protein